MLLEKIEKKKEKNFVLLEKKKEKNGGNFVFTSGKHPKGLSIAPKTLANFLERITQLFEQGFLDHVHGRLPLPLLLPPLEVKRIATRTDGIFELTDLGEAMWRVEHFIRQSKLESVQPEPSSGAAHLDRQARISLCLTPHIPARKHTSRE